MLFESSDYKISTRHVFFSKDVNLFLQPDAIIAEYFVRLMARCVLDACSCYHVTSFMTSAIVHVFMNRDLNLKKMITYNDNVVDFTFYCVLYQIASSYRSYVQRF